MKKLLITLGVGAATFIARADFLGFIGSDTNFLAATNWTVALAPSYAPGLRNDAGKKTELGVSAALLYPVAQFGSDSIVNTLYTGVRADYLRGDVWLPSINVSLDKHFTLFRHADGTGGIHGSAYTITGAGVPVGAQSATSVSFIAGGGIDFTIPLSSRFTFGLGYSGQYWTTPLDKMVHYIPARLSFSF